jgi:hypothetical protein
MKKLFLFLALFVTLQVPAQEDAAKMPLRISAQGNTIDVYLDSNNAKKILTITNKKEDAARLVIMNSDWKKEADFDRSFTLVSDKDEDLQISFMSRMKGTSYALLTDIFAKAQKGKTYKLYTMATPTDPAIAATIRVRRILLCSIAVK